MIESRASPILLDKISAYTTMTFSSLASPLAAELQSSRDQYMKNHKLTRNISTQKSGNVLVPMYQVRLLWTTKKG